MAASRSACTTSAIHSSRLRSLRTRRLPRRPHSPATRTLASPLRSTPASPTTGASTPLRNCSTRGSGHDAIGAGEARVQDSLNGVSRPVTMAETTFGVVYDGPALETGRMPVRDLAPALLALGQLFSEASRFVYPEQEPVSL